MTICHVEIFTTWQSVMWKISPHDRFFLHQHRWWCWWQISGMVHITNKIIKVYLKRESCELSFNPALSLPASTTATLKMTFPFENDGNSIWYLSLPVPHSGLWYLISPLLVCNITALSQMKNTSKTFHITASTYVLFNFFQVGTEVSCFQKSLICQ